MKRVTEADLPAVEAFLHINSDKLMFPWSNLIRYGIAGGHPRAMTFWVNDAGPITDLMGVSDEGMVMPYCPTVMDQAPDVLAGRAVMGFLGESTGIAQMRALLGLELAPLDESEPHFNLDLADMIMPDVGGFTLRPLQDAPREIVTEWRAAFSVETLAVPGADAAEKAVADIDSYIAHDSHRVLYDGDVPLALTGFNASAPGIVQIGGVYTPPPLRCRGYARKAVALHLKEAQVNGVTRATLFAANAAAAAAYRAVGFQEIGRFTIAIYETPQHV